MRLSRDTPLPGLLAEGVLGLGEVYLRHSREACPHGESCFLKGVPLSCSHSPWRWSAHLLSFRAHVQ